MSWLLRTTVFSVCLLGGGSALADTWYPYPIEIHSLLWRSERPYLRLDYVPQQRAEQAWQLCVSLPHLNNAYWLAVNYGLVEEARRQGVAMRVSQAGGYQNAELQIQQIRDCMAAGGQVAIIAAVDDRALNRLVVDLRTEQVPVIDLITGMDSPLVTARITGPAAEMARRVGEQIARRHPSGTRAAQVAWLPGPEQVGFMAQIQRGFTQALARSEARVVISRYGELEAHAQRQLVLQVLEEYPALDYIVGNAVAVEAALPLLEERHLLDQVSVLAYHFTPALLAPIRQDRIAVVPTDSPVILGRIAVDQAVRILEGKPFIANLKSRTLLIDRTNIDTFEQRAVLAPEGFEAILEVQAPAVSRQGDSP